MCETARVHMCVRDMIPWIILATNPSKCSCLFVLFTLVYAFLCIKLLWLKMGENVGCSMSGGPKIFIGCSWEAGEEKTHQIQNLKHKIRTAVQP